ncbi:MAG TPA: [FeFe] hydrogenase H-cluster radical SAM maturase HydE, partial [Deltaproteobacteria bacterium]|nr:[FeFe] hydrogenase H-cluster radical SAM maturase HydE [Deltaproteobacteria bacterium]
MTCTSETARIIAKAVSGEALWKDELVGLLTLTSPEETEALFQAADGVRRSCVGDEIFLRGIIEFSGHC